MNFTTLDGSLREGSKLSDLSSLVNTTREPLRVVRTKVTPVQWDCPAKLQPGGPLHCDQENTRSECTVTGVLELVSPSSVERERCMKSHF